MKRECQLPGTKNAIIAVTGYVCSIRVDDIDASITKARAAGATVEHSKTTPMKSRLTAPVSASRYAFTPGSMSDITAAISPKTSLDSRSFKWDGCRGFRISMIRLRELLKIDSLCRGM
jgi:hypothetical protein